MVRVDADEADAHAGVFEAIGQVLELAHDRSRPDLCIEQVDVHGVFVPECCGEAVDLVDGAQRCRAHHPEQPDGAVGIDDVIEPIATECHGR